MAATGARRPPDLKVWAVDLLERELGGRRQARRGEIVDVLDEDMIVAERDGRRVGVLAHRRSGSEVELAALAVEPLWRRRGVGSELVASLIDLARAAGAKRVWVVNTNDNIGALVFYQRLGLRLTALRPGAVDDARRTLKPSIPEIGENGLPIRDELLMSKRL